MIASLAENGKLVIAILHDMDFVAEKFERVIVMAHGTILADGTSEEIFAQDADTERSQITETIYDTVNARGLPEDEWTRKKK